MTSAAGLHLADIVASPGDQRVLDHVDLKVAAGTCTAVLGPSGAGKTTLLRVVAGLERPRAGTVSIDGHDVTEAPAHRRSVGVVFQEPRLFPHRTVADNVAFGLEVAGVASDERNDRAEALLARVGLDGFGARTVEGLSGGEQQRINLARALAIEPDVLLLDEPLSSVDPERRDALRALVTELTAGITRLHVTHDRAEAAEVGDHVAVLLDGRIVQHDTARTVFQRPTSSEVAELVGATVLAGEVRDGTLRLAGSELPLDGPAGPDGHPAPADGPVSVAVRPEAVRLGTGPLRARVTSVTYRGSTLRVVLDLGDGLCLPADVDPSTEVAHGATIVVDLPHLHRLNTHLDDGATDEH